MGLWLAVALAASCQHPALTELSEAQQEQACALLAEPAAKAGPGSEALTAVYARPRFAHARDRNSGAIKALLAELKAWLEALAETTGATTYANFTRVLVLALALAVAVGLVLRIARGKKRAAVASTPSGAAALQLEDPAVHLERARALVEAQPREAIREGLLSLLSSLERERLARPDRVKTNRELADELPGRGASAAVIAAAGKALRWYDRAFYSLEPVAAESARGFLDEVVATAKLLPSAGGPR